MNFTRAGDAALAVLLLFAGSGCEAAPQAAGQRERMASAATRADPLATLLTHFTLRRDAKVAVVTSPGSCEADHLARMLKAPKMVSLERDDIARPAKPTICRSSSQVVRLAWPTRSPGPVRSFGSGLDLLWIGGHYHTLQARLSPTQLAAFAREVYRAVAPGGSLVVIDVLARAEGLGSHPVRDGVDPQLVLDHFEAAGFRLQTFANDGPVTSDRSGSPDEDGHRFAMIFRKVEANGAH